MRKPKILVGCPTSSLYDYCLEPYIDCVKNLSYENFDVMLVDNSKNKWYYDKIKKLGLNVIKDQWQKNARDRIIGGRNLLREYCLENGYDYFFSLEQDVICPKDSIERLLNWKKKIVSGLYCGTFRSVLNPKEIKILPLVYQHIDKKTYEKMLTHNNFKDSKIRKEVEEGKIKSYKDVMRQCELKEVKDKGLMKVWISGVGCLMIHRDVLEKIKFRYDKEAEGFDDVFFCKDAEKNGFEVFVDTSIHCKHYSKKSWDWRDIRL